jgi:hypothetical protein
MMVFDGKLSIDPSIVTVRWAPACSLLMYEASFQKTDLNKKDIGEMAKIELKMLKSTCHSFR